MVAKSKRNKFITLSKNCVFKATELTTVLGSRTAIQRMCESGELLPLGSGFYHTEAIDPFIATMMVVGKYYPKAVISNLTALLHYRLSDEAIERIEVDIDRRSTLRNRILRVHRVPAAHLVGITDIKLNGTKIRIYSVERALCDAYKLDRGGAIFFKALKRYIKLFRVRPEVIRELDATLKTKVLPHLVQELADA